MQVQSYLSFGIRLTVYYHVTFLKRCIGNFDTSDGYGCTFANIIIA